MARTPVQPPRPRAGKPPRRDDGWIVVDCGADARTPVWIAVGEEELVPAFRDYDEGVRTAKIRDTGQAGPVQLKVGSALSTVGEL